MPDEDTSSLPPPPSDDAGDDSDVVQISALEHWSYCPRQCALIHREQTFDENIYTLRGRFLHERVDEPEGLVEQGIRVERGLPLWSSALRLSGRADLIEFHGETPYPIEYKHGPARLGRHADIQVCAQALCLEEMLSVPVPRGAVYHFSSRKRREVVFTPALRRRTTEAIHEVRSLLQAGNAGDSPLPPAPADARCTNCSLIESCLPFVVSRKAKITAFQQRLYSPLQLTDTAPHPEARRGPRP